MTEANKITLTVNGAEHTLEVPARRHLAEVLREDLGLTGTHLGCEHGVCGACTVKLDGEAARSCLVLAVQADGAEVTTVEGLCEPDGSMGLVQRAMWDKHAFQCAFCAPGVMLTVDCLLADNPAPDTEEIKEALSGNLCRCTGYHSILEGVHEAVALLAATRTEESAGA